MYIIFNIDNSRSLRCHYGKNTAQKKKFSIKDFYGKCDQIRWKLRIWFHLLKKPLMENFIFCAVKVIKENTITPEYSLWCNHLRPINLEVTKIGKRSIY